MSANGGPAFPSLSESKHFESRDESPRIVHETEGGMCLRDYFKAHAPTTWIDARNSCIARGVMAPTSHEIAAELAALSGQYADAQLKESEAAKNAIT